MSSTFFRRHLQLISPDLAVPPTHILVEGSWRETPRGSKPHFTSVNRVAVSECGDLRGEPRPRPSANDGCEMWDLDEFKDTSLTLCFRYLPSTKLTRSPLFFLFRFNCSAIINSTKEERSLSYLHKALFYDSKCSQSLAAGLCAILLLGSYIMVPT